MYNTIDALSHIRPEKTSPHFLSECFGGDTAPLRTVAALKVLGFIAAKVLILLFLTLAIIYSVSTGFNYGS